MADSVKKPIKANMGQNCGTSQFWFPVNIKHTGAAASNKVNMKNEMSLGIILFNFLQI